jgi:hypothetical protein
MYDVDGLVIPVLGKEIKVRNKTPAILGIGNVFILVICLIGFSILPALFLGDEEAVEAGSSIGAAAGLVFAAGMILGIKKIRDRLQKN